MLDRRTFIVGACAAPLADSPYARALSAAVGRPVDPLAAHRDALAESRRLARRADVLLRGQGLRAGSVAERLRTLAADARWLFEDSDAGRNAAVAQMNAALAGVRPGLARVFDLPIPPAEVRRMSPADETAGRGGYRAAEGYYVDLSKIRIRPAWTLASVAFHETIPGHRIQADFAAAHPPAFSEAWAIYAEGLAADLGVYAGDPRGELGFIQWRLFRTARVVADTGIGALAWTKGEAAQAMRELQGFDIAFTTMSIDVDRMVDQPANYAAHGVLALQLSASRPRGPGAWRAWHRQVLTGVARTAGQGA